MASLVRGPPGGALVSPCAAATGGLSRGWCVENDPPVVKIRAAGTPDPGLCLQLHNGNFSIGNDLWLWDCSVGRDGTMSFSHVGGKLKLQKNGVEFCAAASPAGTVLLKVGGNAMRVYFIQSGEAKVTLPTAVAV